MVAAVARELLTRGLSHADVGVVSPYTAQVPAAALGPRPAAPAQLPVRALTHRATAAPPSPLRCICCLGCCSRCSPWRERRWRCPGARPTGCRPVTLASAGACPASHAAPAPPQPPHHTRASRVLEAHILAGSPVAATQRGWLPGPREGGHGVQHGARKPRCEHWLPGGLAAAQRGHHPRAPVGRPRAGLRALAPALEQAGISAPGLLYW